MILGVLFFLVILKFIFSSGQDNVSSGIPDQAAAYRMAQQFIRNKAKADKLKFPDTGYRFAKKSDSVFVINTIAEVQTGVENKKVNCFVMLKYNGGPGNNEDSWTILDMSQN